MERSRPLRMDVNEEASTHYGASGSASVCFPGVRRDIESTFNVKGSSFGLEHWAGPRSGPAYCLEFGEPRGWTYSLWGLAYSFRG